MPNGPWPMKSAGMAAAVEGLPSRKLMRMLVDGAMWTPWKPIDAEESERRAMILFCDDTQSTHIARALSMKQDASTRATLACD